MLFQSVLVVCVYKVIFVSSQIQVRYGILPKTQVKHASFKTTVEERKRKHDLRSRSRFHGHCTKKRSALIMHGSFSRMDKSQTRTSHNLTHFSCFFFLPPALMMSMCKSRPLRRVGKSKREGAQSSSTQLARRTMLISTSFATLQESLPSKHSRPSLPHTLGFVPCTKRGKWMCTSATIPGTTFPFLGPIMGLLRYACLGLRVCAFLLYDKLIKCVAVPFLPLLLLLLSLTCQKQVHHKCYTGIRATYV